MQNHLIQKVKLNMKNCLDSLNKYMNSINVGQVSPTLLNNIVVECYGKNNFLYQLSNITVENSNTLKINVFDNSIIRKIEKAIFHSNLDVSPVIQGNIIRVIIPNLTLERRQNLYKLIKSESEKSKVSIRNIRRDANDTLKNQSKNKIINEDEVHFLNEEIQLLTNKYINKINDLLLNKKNQILNI